ncbi:hypothetical protein [Pantoea sp. 18069]|uniref:hypothetical protein n=1 Tax=Pantoea sp. 18069 TaxID=2681415 RepID=UPI00135B6AC5|nr:hypothetical protein [Pantoea sp. 18069]
MSDEKFDPKEIPNSKLEGEVEVPGQPGRPSAAESSITPNVALGMEATQLGKFSTKGGTGFAAEDANALFDERMGRTVERTGLDNAKNGADRIVDGVSIQTKYFDSASRSVNSAFDSETGLYRYDTMQLEVPKDQYEAAVKLMEKRISEGKVPGVTNPADAPKMVRQGNVTYQQARNIARAGNIDSLTYDARNSAVICSAAFGFSFVVEFSSGIWRGENPVGAMKNAALKGIQTAGIAFFTSVGSAQLLRTQAARMGTIFIRSGLKNVSKTNLGKSAIHRIAEVSLGKSVTGAAAVNHVSKLLRSNAITGAVTVTVLTLPDLYKASISGSASWAQLGKNLVVNTTSVAAGTGGWIGGTAAGAALGSAFPVVGTVIGGTVGGVLGMLGGGVAGGFGAKKAMDYLIEDDAVEMQAILNKELQLIANDYLFTQQEFDKYLELVGDIIPNSFLGDLYAAKDRPAYIRQHFEEYAYELTKNRQPIVMVTDEKVLAFIGQMLERAEAGEPLDDAAPYDPAAYAPNFVLSSGPLSPIDTSSAIELAAVFAKQNTGLAGTILGKFL